MSECKYCPYVIQKQKATPVLSDHALKKYVSECNTKQAMWTRSHFIKDTTDIWPE